MDALAFGARYPDGAPIVGDLDPDALLDGIAGATADARRVRAAPWVFDERERRRQPRLEEPAEAGWTYVVAGDEPDADGVIAALQRLATHRGMPQPDAPLRFPAGADRGDWIDHDYKGLGDARPRYVLLAGDPARLPFTLQVDLAAAGAVVGRVSFDGGGRLDALGAYVDKVVRLETADDPVPTATALVVATDGGPFDATTYSSRYLAPPVSGLLHDEARLEVRLVAGRDATTDGVRSALATGRPAVAFTATHGAVADRAGAGPGPAEVNGAWACAPADPDQRPNQWDWLTAEDLPDGPVVPGGLVVQFACFGYGTTDQSSFGRWLGAGDIVESDPPFVAAVPQRLLANPDGPIAYVGHVDVALAHGFVDPGVAVPPGTTHPRIQPFLTLFARAVRDLTPVGYATRDLHERAAALGSELVTTFDGLQEADTSVADLEAADKARLIDKVIRRNDAMHFLVFGDPAARVRVGDR